MGADGAFTNRRATVGTALAGRGNRPFLCSAARAQANRGVGYTYSRVAKDAYYARKVEIRSRNEGRSDEKIACSTVDEFVRSMIS